MALPMLRHCCGCLSLERGCLVLGIVSIQACVLYIIAGSWNLPNHREREREDNLISMTMVMFSTLSAISNLVVLIGICRRRPNYLQLSLLFNSVFILCIFLVAGVTCLFSPEFRPVLQSPGNVTLVVVSLVLGAAYSLYYLIVVNSLYRKMKMSYSETALPM
ncbi:uncharacterized protein LOC123697261 isoform X2 [Colias croceus]|nr:uncharacterized protein LOC123697261 isoform X2 [Colias croceus]XP_045499672.1 uncharacterized protein LOC123697261 isoform X2 [Colias croceus]XP_045499673.1 uncharacterized protein LOC123697261 isoform X2 [Colias croceus]XP_045499674.1 uncharacterized protein LOC123697261 isoform X2 [Colias croceus]CAG4961500.1 unnamed protein product [Colias eurytheme]